MVQLSHPYMTTEKTIALTRWTFAGKVMSLLFNMLSRLVITFLPRSKHLFISWLQSPSAVIWEPKKIKSDTVSVNTVQKVFPVLMLGKMVPPCPFEVMKGHTTCFGQIYMRSDVVHFPSKTLRVSSQCITFSSFPYATITSNGPDSRGYISLSCGVKSMQSRAASQPAVTMQQSKKQTLRLVLLPKHNPSSLL